MLDKTSGNKIAEGKILLDHMDKIHTTEMGVERIKKNLKIKDADVVEYCKKRIVRFINKVKIGIVKRIMLR